MIGLTPALPARPVAAPDAGPYLIRNLDWDDLPRMTAIGKDGPESGRRVEAEGLYRSAVGRRERLAQDGWPASAGAAAHTLRGLAGLCRGAGRADEADELDRRAADWARRRSEAMPWEP